MHRQERWVLGSFCIARIHPLRGAARKKDFSQTAVQKEAVVVHQQTVIHLLHEPAVGNILVISATSHIVQWGDEDCLECPRYLMRLK